MVRIAGTAGEMRTEVPMAPDSRAETAAKMPEMVTITVRKIKMAVTVISAKAIRITITVTGEAAGEIPAAKTAKAQKEIFLPDRIAIIRAQAADGISGMTGRAADAILSRAEITGQIVSRTETRLAVIMETVKHRVNHERRESSAR